MVSHHFPFRNGYPSGGQNDVIAGKQHRHARRHEDPVLGDGIRGRGALPSGEHRCPGQTMAERRGGGGGVEEIPVISVNLSQCHVFVFKPDARKFNPSSGTGGSSEKNMNLIVQNSHQPPICECPREARDRPLGSQLSQSSKLSNDNLAICFILLWRDAVWSQTNIWGD